ncbi:hypothetical protein ACFRH4_41550 [Streptomyces mirabilis]|uniref:hypothetical protein n=1 Tax=Streptomyces mirabilis TaxID=68239 RepID=UPI0036985832
MNHLTHILAGTIMDLDVTIRSSYVPDPVDPDDPRGVAPADAANLLEPISAVKEALGQAPEQDRRELVQLFRGIAAQVPERGRPFATALCEEMASVLDQPHEQGQGQAGITRSLAKAVMDILNAIELADEDIIDDDDAVKIIEWVSGNLNNALAKRPEEDRQELVRLLCDIAGEEQDPERRELALQFPEAVGLVPEE